MTAIISRIKLFSMKNIFKGQVDKSYRKTQWKSNVEERYIPIEPLLTKPHGVPRFKIDNNYANIEKMQEERLTQLTRIQELKKEYDNLNIDEQKEVDEEIENIKIKFKKLGLMDDKGNITIKYK